MTYRMAEAGDQDDGSGVVALRPPPCDLQAEAAVLSACLLDGAQVALVPWLEPEHFFSNAHQRIWEAIAHLHRTGTPVDTVSVAVRLRETGRIAEVGGVEYLTAILDTAPAVVHVERYAQVVHDRYRARAVVAACQHIAASGYAPIADTQAWADGAASSLDRVARMKAGVALESNLDALTRALREIHERMEARAHGNYTKAGIPTGFPSVDRLTGGYHAGGIHVLAGLRARGKSTYARQSARHVAGLGLGVMIFCTEGSRDEWLRLLLAAEAGVDARGLLDGALTADEWCRVYAAMPVLGALPLHVDDTADLGPLGVRAAILAYQAARRPTDPVLGLAVVDHLHRLKADPDHARLKRYDALYQSIRRLKNQARQLMVPHLVLAQQRVLGERGSAADPKPHDQAIKECPAVEDEADDLIFLWRVPRGKFEDTRTAQTMAVVTKARFGVEGEAVFEADLEHGRFVDHAGVADAAGPEPLLPPDVELPYG